MYFRYNQFIIQGNQFIIIFFYKLVVFGFKVFFLVLPATSLIFFSMAGGEGEISNPSSETCKVSVKLPPFWPNKPAVWFAQVEAQFDIAGIVADSTKYSYVVGQIDHKYAGEIEDILVHPRKVGNSMKL